MSAALPRRATLAAALLLPYPATAYVAAKQGSDLVALAASIIDDIEEMDRLSARCSELADKLADEGGVTVEIEPECSDLTASGFAVYQACRAKEQEMASTPARCMADLTAKAQVLARLDASQPQPLALSIAQDILRGVAP